MSLLTATWHVERALSKCRQWSQKNPKPNLRYSFPAFSWPTKKLKTE